MSTSNPREYQRHSVSALFLLILGTFFGVLTIISAIIGTAIGGIICGVLAIIFFNNAFDSLEKRELYRPDELKEVYEKYHDLDLFSASLKSGNKVNVHLQILFEGTQTAHHILERIHAELQLELNKYLTRRDSLSDDPYEEIDTLLQQAATHLRSELALDRLIIRTIGIKVGPKAQAGMFYGTER